MAVGNRSLIELPDLNLEFILLNLPLISLLVCCSLSKLLFRLILKNPMFAQKHFAKSKPHLMIHSPSRSTFHLLDMNADALPALGERVDVKPVFFLPLDGYRVTHSCNGFVLMEYENTVDCIHKCIVSNPVTGEYTKLPETEHLYRHAKCAFFYNPDDNQLMILRLFIRLFLYTPDSDESSDSEELLAESTGTDFTFPYPEEDRMGELFVLGSDSWESIVTFPFCPNTIYSPCHLDKVTHWLCIDHDKDEDYIVFFNFESHTFGYLSSLAFMVQTDVHGCYDMVLVVDHGSLSVIDFVAYMGWFSIWRMNEYGNEDSWTLNYVIHTIVRDVPHEPFFMSNEKFVYLNNGDMVITCSDGCVFFYDLVNMTGRLVNHPPIQLSSVVVAHTPSLISLSKVVGNGNLEVLKVPPRFAQPELFTHNYIELLATFFT